MKRTIVAISIITFIFIISTIVVSLSILKNNIISTNINIISLSNVTTKYHLIFEKIEKAEEYEINVYHDDDSLFYTQKSEENDLFLSLDNIEYNKKYHLIVYAYNANGENIAVSKSYGFVYNEPTFSKDNEILLTNNQDYIVHIDGNLNKKNYYIAICDGDYVIKKEKITGNDYTIPSKLFTGLKQSFIINLYDNNTVINSYTVYSNISPVSDIKIINHKDGDTLPYEDFAVKYSGGENATSYVLQIFKGNLIIKEIKITNNTIIISKEFFKKGEKYTIRIRALYNEISEYAKSDSVEITISSQDTLFPPYINVYPNYYKANREIKLINPNDSGKIYYTIDGKNPNTDGIEYKESIKLSKDIILKTVIKNNNDISSIGEYKIKIAEKDKYTIFLSGNSSNNIVNYIEKKLMDKDVVVYREDNTPIISDARFKNSDLYLSINVEEKQSLGYNIWINEEKTLSYSLANMVNNKLNEIYSTKDNVKYAEGSLKELNENIPLSMIINFTYNSADNMFPDDYNLIGDQIVNQILDYFGIN